MSPASVPLMAAHLTCSDSGRDPRPFSGIAFWRALVKSPEADCCRPSRHISPPTTLSICTTHFGACTGTRYTEALIKTFRHRGLKRLFRDSDASGIRANQRARVLDVLAHLDTAIQPADLDLPGYRLHVLKGDLKGHWSISISGNWRITFRFTEGGCFDVDLTDYH